MARLSVTSSERGLSNLTEVVNPTPIKPAYSAEGRLISFLTYQGALEIVSA